MEYKFSEKKIQHTTDKILRGYPSDTKSIFIDPTLIGDARWVAQEHNLGRFHPFTGHEGPLGRVEV
jgi:hypothetical protein